MSATEPIAATTHMGAVHLTVADLERSLEYYRESIGLDVLNEGDGRATLGAGTARLLELVEVPGAQPARAAPASSTSPCCCRTAAASRAGSRTRCARACAWRARRIIS